MTLRKGFTRLEGVNQAKLILRPPHMEVRMKTGHWPDLEKMTETIRKAGYKPIEGGIVLVVTGKVVKRGDRLVLELDRMKSPAALLVAPGDDPETAAHLERHLGEQVEVEGAWQAAESGPGSLAVTAIHETEEHE